MIYHSLSFLVTYRIWITEPGLVSELPTKNNCTIWGILKKTSVFLGGLFNWYIFPFLVNILYQQRWLWASGRQSAIGFCWFFLVLLSRDFPKTPIKVRKITSHPSCRYFGVKVRNHQILILSCKYFGSKDERWWLWANVRQSENAPQSWLSEILQRLKLGSIPSWQAARILFLGAIIHKYTIIHNDTQ